jgi:hypothetical protein
LKSTARQRNYKNHHLTPVCEEDHTGSAGDCRCAESTCIRALGGLNRNQATISKYFGPPFDIRREQPLRSARLGAVMSSQVVHGPYEFHDLGVFELESGDQIRGLKLANATFGALKLQRRDRPVLSELLASPA